MKRFIKTALSLLIVLTVIMGLVSTSFADDSSVVYLGKDKGFGFAPGSEYTDTDLFDNFKGLMPGETVTEEITVTNESTDSDYIKLYLRAKVHDEVENPLHENVAATGATVATMTEFMSQLSMTVWNGDTSGEPIFNAAPNELGGLAEGVLLGTFHSGESTVLNVQLEIPATLDNKFQNMVGEVDWVFTAELFDYPEPPVNDKTVTVNKIWDDNGIDRPESITVELLRNGEHYADAILTADCQWTYTWGELERDAAWTVIESEVPEGYTASYKTDGNIVTITNTADKAPEAPVPAEKIGLTAKKIWSGDEDRIKSRPDKAEITLYNGSEAVETVILGEWNNWEYTWKDLSPDGDWKVIESNIPKGYTPAYSVDGEVVTINNVASLIQTGQMKWQVLALSCAGTLMLFAGAVMILRKRKSGNA